MDRAIQSKKPEDITLAIMERGSGASQPVLAQTFLRAGALSISAGAMKEAFLYSERALDICRTLSDDLCVAFTTNNSGLAARRLGDYETSRSRLTEAAGYWRSVHNSRREGIALSNLGLLYWQSGEYGTAIATLNRAALLTKGTSLEAYVLAQSNLGLCYLSLTEYDRARTYFQSYLDAARTSKNATLIKGVPRVRSNLGRTWLGSGNLPLAVSTLRTASTEAHAAKENVAELGALSHLGDALIKAGDFEGATRALKDALPLARAAGDRQAESRCLNGLGVLSSKAGRYEEARTWLNDAIRIRKTSGARDDEAESILALALNEQSAGDLTLARTLGNQALDLFESVRQFA